MVSYKMMWSRQWPLRHCGWHPWSIELAIFQTIKSSMFMPVKKCTKSLIKIFVLIHFLAQIWMEPHWQEKISPVPAQPALPCLLALPALPDSQNRNSHGKCMEDYVFICISTLHAGSSSYQSMNKLWKDMKGYERQVPRNKLPSQPIHPCASRLQHPQMASPQPDKDTMARTHTCIDMLDIEHMHQCKKNFSKCTWMNKIE